MTDWIGRAYSQYADALHRYAVIVLANPSEAADVVHQVFAALLRRRPANIEHLGAYLRRAVRNECYSRLRGRMREEVAESPLLEPIAALDEPHLRLMIERALRALPAEQREVVQLKVFEGHTFQEIATITGESVNTVASRYRYALDKLRLTL
jgi:RNA polymerase sigma-70 factor (ECF subfamily)